MPKIAAILPLIVLLGACSSSSNSPTPGSPDTGVPIEASEPLIEASVDSASSLEDVSVSEDAAVAETGAEGGELSVDAAPEASVDAVPEASVGLDVTTVPDVAAPKICEESAVQCQSSGSVVAACDTSPCKTVTCINNQWSAGAACPSTKPLCSNGTCVECVGNATVCDGSYDIAKCVNGTLQHLVYCQNYRDSYGSLCSCGSSGAKVVCKRGGETCYTP